jgi:hypothetical protein
LLLILIKYLKALTETASVFDADPTFPSIKFLGVRGLHDLALARQGYADDEDTALQVHYTNSAPAIADINGDGQPEVIFNTYSTQDGTGELIILSSPS